MLVGYVSDERYVAIPEVLLEFEAGGESIEARSRATGAVYAEVTPGRGVQGHTGVPRLRF